MPRRFAGARARAIDRIPAGSFVRGASVIALGTGLAQLLVVATSPILTRLFSPSEFGSYSVAMAIIAIVAVVSTLSYEEAIPLPFRDSAAANVLALCVVVATATGIASMVLLLLFGPTILSLAGAPELAPIAFLIGFAVVGSGLALAFLGWTVRVKMYREIALNRVTRAGSGAIAQISLGLLGTGALGLFVGAIIATYIAMLRLVVVSWRNHRATYSRVTRVGVIASARRYRRFPLLTAPATLLNTVGLEAPLLIIVALFGTTVGGQAALAFRVMAAPLTLISNAIGNTYFAEAAVVVREQPFELRRLYLRTTGALALISIGPIVVGALLAPWLFGIIFGEEWTEAGVFAMVLAPMYFMQLITNPTHGTLVVLERQDLHLQRELARLVLLAAAVVLTLALDLGPLGAMIAIGVSGFLMYSWYGITSWRAIGSYEAKLRERA